MKSSSLRLIFALSVCAFSASAQTLPTYTVTNVIGNGTAGFAGDSGAAKDAQVNFPTAIARASNGTLYIADTFNNRIRTVQSDGIIRTVVGTGTAGFSGDGATATSALIRSPYGVAVDAAGNLFFSDTLNNIIRKVTPAGIISRFAGTGVQGFGGDGGKAVDALFNLPTAIAVDAAGNVYVADTFNNRIRKILADGSQITTYVGTGEPNYQGDGQTGTSAAIYRPEGIAFDSAGNLYIADTYNQRVRKVSSDGTVSTIAGTGIAGFRGDGSAATNAQLNYPRGVAADASGTVYVVDSINNRVRAVTENGIIQTIAGSGRFGDAGENIPATIADLRFPRAVVPDGSGNLYLLDTDNNRIRLLTRNAAPPTLNSGGVVSSSAFGGFRTAASGSWLEIYGTNLAQGTREWTGADFVDGKAPTSLSGTSVTINGQPAFVSYISPGQVNVQVPDSLQPGTYPLIVTSPQGSSTAYSITIEATQPGIFAPASFAKDGKQYAGVVLQDGSVAGTADRRLRPGDTVTLYGIGFGSVAPYTAAGEVTRNANSVVLPLQVYFGDAPATVTYAGLAPGTLGLYQINIVVPAVPENAALPLSFKLNGEAGEQTLYTAVGK